jgi:hypothetical protein
MESASTTWTVREFATASMGYPASWAASGAAAHTGEPAAYGWVVQ